ncbi:MAG: tRNA (guanine(26)-N(2))-dimethyltransferase [Candidatus Woesearchaeota archaeon]|nr:tRNA (guanine(26)-N(2))-dimethyltransferase [Candidatus Woesearchaeota archaeon]
MLWQLITEGNIKIRVPRANIVSRELPVFYNPVMALNRNISITFLRALNRSGLQIADPLAGSGIRSLRFLKELPNKMINQLFVNDANPKFKKIWSQSLKLNKLKPEHIVLGNTDASLFMLSQSGFDYIDVDPFGSPNPFLDAACKRLARGGILAVTATDTAPLAGTYPKTCKRKYDAIPLLDECKHETAIRILLRKIQLVAAQYEKALTPVFCYAHEHYYRVFLICEKSKTKVDEILKQHGLWRSAGPLWLGSLWDSTFVSKMLKLARFPDEKKLLSKITAESRISSTGFVDVHAECKRLRISVPPFAKIIGLIEKKGYAIVSTHFSSTGLRTNMSREEFVQLLKTYSKN